MNRKRTIVESNEAITLQWNLESSLERNTDLHERDHSRYGDKVILGQRTQINHTRTLRCRLFRATDWNLWSAKGGDSFIGTSTFNDLLMQRLSSGDYNAWDDDAGSSSSSSWLDALAKWTKLANKIRISRFSQDKYFPFQRAMISDLINSITWASSLPRRLPFLTIRPTLKVSGLTNQCPRKCSAQIGPICNTSFSNDSIQKLYIW